MTPKLLLPYIGQRIQTSKALTKVTVTRSKDVTIL